jgi:hypothetical protein
MAINHLSWVKSLNAKLAYEARLMDLAMKVAENQKPDTSSFPKDKGGVHKPRTIEKFKVLIEEAKVEKQKRLERERKKKQNKGDNYVKN